MARLRGILTLAHSIVSCLNLADSGASTIFRATVSQCKDLPKSNIAGSCNKWRGGSICGDETDEEEGNFFSELKGRRAFGTGISSASTDLDGALESNKTLGIFNGTNSYDLIPDANTANLSSEKGDHGKNLLTEGGASAVEHQVVLKTEDGSKPTNCTSESLNVETMRQDASVTERCMEAKSLRTEGKSYHDSGDLDRAAEVFRRAGCILDEVLEEQQLGLDGPLNERLHVEELIALAEEAATCRLHEALCQLKNHRPEECLLACSSVINDFSDQSASLPSHSVSPGSNSIVSGSNGSGLYHGVSLSSAVRSRAYHRRAKGKLALHDHEGALADARSAAFLGDRGAVALYGKLMRQNQQRQEMANKNCGGAFESTLDHFGSQGSNNGGQQNFLLGPEAASLAGALGGSKLAESPSLFSLLGDAQQRNECDAFPSGDGLAKSVIASIGKRLDEEETQRTICTLLNSFASKEAISQIGSMVGLSLSEAHVNKIVHLCSGLTPQALRRGVSCAKKAIWMLTVSRKSVKVLAKYRYLLVYALLIKWITSAASRPLVV